MEIIIVYCVFCYLVHIGICIGQKDWGIMSLLFAPIFTPILIGAFIGVATRRME